MILDPLSIATIGYVAPFTATSWAPLPLPIGSHGYIVIAPSGGRLADPRSRLSEPFDRDYYRRKYRREIERQERARTPIKTGQEAPLKPPPKLEPVSVLGKAMREESAVVATAREVASLEARNRDVDQDILDLQAYIREVATGLETGLAAQVAAAELRAEQQAAFIERLRAALIDAREALLVALEVKRRRQNQLAAIEATIRYYF